MPYASSTTVTVSRSKEEIDKMLARYGAHRRGVLEEPGKAVVVFERDERRVQIEMKLPSPDQKDLLRKRSRNGQAAGKPDPAKHDQAVRQRWRALALVLKAKLEAVEAGITTFEAEFLAHIVIPGHGTVGQWAAPQLLRLHRAGGHLPLLPGGTSGSAAS